MKLSTIYWLSAHTSRCHKGIAIVKPVDPAERGAGGDVVRALFATKREAASSEGLGGVLLQRKNRQDAIGRGVRRLDRRGSGGVGGLAHESQRQQEQHKGDDSAHLGRSGGSARQQTETGQSGEQGSSGVCVTYHWVLI